MYTGDTCKNILCISSNKILFNISNISKIDNVECKYTVVR